AKLSQTSRAKLLVIDYRLAPETAFPGAVEDAVKAYRWLLSQGYAPEKLAISGDSAGGGLSVATLVSLRDAGLPLPKTAALLSPWSDLTGESETMTTRAEQDPMVQKDMLLMMAGLYLNGADPKTPLASPLFADLQNLPPMLVQVGDHETLLNDSLTLAERAKSAGVDVTLEVWDEMIHVWQLFYQMLPEGTQALDRIGEYLVEKWG
ncbi:MAG TPA: alpha/beta hydrolase, partial [Alphaproteobacteria bacterium]|nr:alpha/beta hydrolase [Alphaproteobacteria bacterium]